jgi:hypothetical protein
MRHASRWAVFALVAIAQFMVVLDTAIISVALPVIKHQLHFSNWRAGHRSEARHDGHAEAARRARQRAVTAAGTEKAGC